MVVSIPINTNNFQFSVWLINRSITGTTTPGQSNTDGFVDFMACQFLKGYLMPKTFFKQLYGLS